MHTLDKELESRGTYIRTVTGTKSRFSTAHRVIIMETTLALTVTMLVLAVPSQALVRFLAYYFRFEKVFFFQDFFFIATNQQTKPGYCHFYSTERRC